MRARARASSSFCRRGRALFSAALLLSGCNLYNPGDQPPAAALYVPTALALAPHEPGSAPRHLFVANSNFDLRFKGGTVQAFSLDELDRRTEDCRADDPCTVDTEDVLVDEVIISSFATSLVASPDGRFLFATTRTDGSLAFIPLDAEADGDAVLDCGEDGPGCGLYAARGADSNRPGERLQWPNDPAAVTAGPLSNWTGDPDDQLLYALVAHRGGEVSLFIEQDDPAPDDPERFELRSVLRGLQPPLTNVGFDPATGFAYLTVGAYGLARVGVVPPQGEDELGSIYFAGAVRLQSLTAAPDTRDVSFMAARSDAGDALAKPSALVVANQPSALLLADIDAANATDDARIKRTAVVGAGASRVTTGMLGDRLTAVVACFDARAVFVIDVETMLTRSVVPNLSGPFEIELDEVRARVYVADFRSSVIRVIDLSALAESQGEASAAVIATLGEPRVLQELR